MSIIDKLKEFNYSEYEGIIITHNPNFPKNNYCFNLTQIEELNEFAEMVEELGLNFRLPPIEESSSRITKFFETLKMLYPKLTKKLTRYFKIIRYEGIKLVNFAKGLGCVLVNSEDYKILEKKAFPLEKYPVSKGLNEKSKIVELSAKYGFHYYTKTQDSIIYPFGFFSIKIRKESDGIEKPLRFQLVISPKKKHIAQCGNVISRCLKDVNKSFNEEFQSKSIYEIFPAIKNHMKLNNAIYHLDVENCYNSIDKNKLFEYFSKYLPNKKYQIFKSYVSKEQFIEYIKAFTNSIHFKLRNRNIIRVQKFGIPFGFDASVEINHFFQMCCMTEIRKKNKDILKLYRMVDDYAIITRFYNPNIIKEFIKDFKKECHQNMTIKGNVKSECKFGGIKFSNNTQTTLVIKQPTLSQIIHRFSYDDIRDKFSSIITRLAKIAIFNNNPETIKEQTKLMYLTIKSKCYQQSDLVAIAKRTEYSVLEFFRKYYNQPHNEKLENYAIDYSQFIDEETKFKTFNLFSLFGNCSTPFALKIFKKIGFPDNDYYKNKSVKVKPDFIKSVSKNAALISETIGNLHKIYSTKNIADYQKPDHLSTINFESSSKTLLRSKTHNMLIKNIEKIKL